jgi:hypothetical protein
MKLLQFRYLIFLLALTTGLGREAVASGIENDTIQDHQPDQATIAPERAVSFDTKDHQALTEGQQYNESIQAVQPSKRKKSVHLPKRETWEGQARVILILLGIAALIALAFFLIRHGITRKKSTEVLSVEEMENHFETIIERGDSPQDMLQRQLDLSIKSGDYRTGVRIVYLGLLAEMHHLKIILWKKDKTNSDYLKELNQHQQYASFSYLTSVFELVWYGNQQPGSADFAHYRQKAELLKSEIKVPETL